MSIDLQQARCVVCNTTSSPLWRRNEEDAVVCLECHTSKKTETDKSSVASNSGTDSSNNSAPKKKKNNRKTKVDKGGRINNSSLANTVTKISYRGRRSLTKETVRISSFNPMNVSCIITIPQPIKSPAPEPMVLTTSSVLYKVYIHNSTCPNV